MRVGRAELICVSVQSKRLRSEKDCIKMYIFQGAVNMTSACQWVRPGVAVGALH
jgi:hypothetical protein